MVPHTPKPQSFSKLPPTKQPQAPPQLPPGRQAGAAPPPIPTTERPSGRARTGNPQLCDHIFIKNYPRQKINLIYLYLWYHILPFFMMVGKKFDFLVSSQFFTFSCWSLFLNIFSIVLCLCVNSKIKFNLPFLGISSSVFLHSDGNECNRFCHISLFLIDQYS